MTSGIGAERSTFTRLAVLWLAGVDLRVTMLALPPLLVLIHRDLGLSEAAVGALTSLPALMMGAAAVLGSLLIARAGARRAAIAGLFTVAVSAALRGDGPSVVTLFAMTLIMGAGIAVMQPAVPALVARWCPDRIGFATALYVNGLLVGEALGAAFTLPLVLPAVRGSWPAALAAWSVLPLVTAVLMLGLGKRLPDAAVGPETRWWPDWGRPETWRLGLVLGGVGTAYFGSNAFIPDFLRTAGRADLIGPCLAALNVGQLPASAIALVVARAITGQRAPLLAVPVAISLSLALFLIAPPGLWVLAAGVIGFCCAFGLVLSMALPPLVAEAAEVHHVSAGMFASGYAYSFLMPLLGGVAWDVTHLPAAAFLPAFAGVATTFAAALGLPRRAGLGRGEIREVVG